MEYGTRIIYNPETGQIITVLGKMKGDLQQGLRPKNMDYIDLPYDNTLLEKALTYHIDINSKSIIVDEYRNKEKSKDEQIKELKNELLTTQNEIIQNEYNKLIKENKINENI